MKRIETGSRPKVIRAAEKKKILAQKSKDNVWAMIESPPGNYVALQSAVENKAARADSTRHLNSSRPPDVHHSGFPSVGILRIYFNEIEPSRRLERHEATIVFGKVRLWYKTRNRESSRADLNVSNQAYAWRTGEKGRRDREYNVQWRGTRGARILEVQSYGYCKLRMENQYVGDLNVFNRIRAIYGAPERAGTINVAEPQCAKQVARVREGRAVTQRPVCAERQHGAQAELNVAPESKVFQAYDHRGKNIS
ncbi:hypothetical protein B0H14DRAFT_3731065 [Mycena olivaceomarginata]|nr:hypothetical protein B0H14DRAFT_3731065 [Mycena olivaceomarginata]